jgi:hypothetical protein
MTLVWKDCSDGQWRAPAVSFRDGARWIEVGGTYVIEQLGGSAFTADYRDEGRRFSVTYQNGGSITVLGICRTIGGAHVLTEAHYGCICAACRKYPRDLVGMQSEETHGLRWFDLPVKIRRRWWKETNYNSRSPSPEFLARLPQLLAAAQHKVEEIAQEVAADLERARKFLDALPLPPCGDCLRPRSPCEQRCLRAMLMSEAERVAAEKRLAEE